MLRLNNESKIQMRQNIQRHRQKLLQCLENSNNTFLKPKIKSISKNLEKFTLNHNVKPKTASSTELLSSKFEPTKVTTRKTRSYVQKKQFKPVITIKEKNLEVLKDADKKKNKTRTSVTLNKLQPNIKVNIQAELPISNVELKSTPIPTIDKKDPEPPEPVIKKLKDQLIEELYNSSSSEDIDDYISVESFEFSATKSMSDVHDNDSSNLIPVGVNKHYEHEQPPDSDKSKKDCKYLLNRLINNSSAKKTRDHIAQNFDILEKACSYLKTNRCIPSRRIILLAAIKECRLLKSFESKLIEEKKLLRKANAILKNRVTELTEMTE